MTDVSTGARTLHTHVQHVMGTAFGITVDDTVGPEGVDDAFAWLHHVDATFSTYRSDSEISRIDRGELDLDAASPDVRQVLLRCAELEELTDGWFTAHRQTDGEQHLDPSGLVKGWSIDVAALILRMAGTTTFSINGGGDIVCAGHPEPNEGRGWRTGIRHPFLEEAVAAVLVLAEGAVATSGTYERGSHIWGAAGTDLPRAAGAPGLAGVTVVGPELGTADALATAVFAEGSGHPAWFDRFPGYDLLLVTADQRLAWTPGLDDLLVRTA
ncbi:MAG: thiamine biosynthesis protein [Acidimicrobiales bacterium]|nr:thiamine biosynthesis protein [Acidimicrobiales bacterium]